MKIEVKFDELTIKNYEDIINFYNNNKAKNMNKIYKLPRCEGGFQIDIPEDKIDKNQFNCNYKIKQLRWNKKLLDPLGWIGFNNEEVELLYLSFCSVFSKEEVILHK